MAFRFRLLLAGLLLLLGIGCRRPLTPNADNNAAPETWITAAPQDTITLRDEQGRPLPLDPSNYNIAFRFHLYWAGSDHDGDVRGFYYAVTETVPTPGVDEEPPLPGPKPSDYKFTTKTDTTFIFNVVEDLRTRRHGFYIYAVDNQGKADPTPARFVFISVDRFPPVAIITHSYGAGYYRDQRGGPGAQPQYLLYPLTGTPVAGVTPRDTIPSGSRVSFGWDDQVTLAGNDAVAFRYKLDESAFVTPPAGTDSVSYAAGTVNPGLKVFEVRAIDVAGATSSQATKRDFIVNFSPDTWYNGPDPTNTYWQRNTPDDGQRFRNLANWSAIPTTGIPGSLYGPDSMTTLPWDRPKRKTFLEMYRNRIYVRAENDTVDMNSWVCMLAGGFDPDSPYNVRVEGFKFDTTAGAVVQRRPPNGSPVGFRLFVPVYLYPAGPLSSLPQSQIYPLDEAINVPEKHFFGYIGMQQSGRAYAIVRAIDGDGRADDRIQASKGIVDSIEAGLISPSHPRYPLRDRVLTFYVNRAPYMLTWQRGFQPKPDTTYATRTIGPFNWGSFAVDDDPYDPSQRTPGGPPVGTTPTPRYRWTLSIRGATATDPNFVYRPDSPLYYRSDVPPTSITVPNIFTGTRVTLEIELCDFPTADFIPGQGRCRNYSIPINIPPPSLAPEASAARARPGDAAGPGSTNTSNGGMK